METLPSGLHKLVGDQEDLARFLASSSHYNSKGVKQAAFLPSPKDRETSVFRHGAEPLDQLWSLAGHLVAGERNLHGAAIVKARHVRAAQLEVASDEPPARHAVIKGWPWDWADPDMQKAKQKEMALVIASEAILVRP